MSGFCTHVRLTSLIAASLLMAICFASACESGPRATQKPETSLVGSPPKEKPRQKREVPAQEQADAEAEDVRVELVMLQKGNPYETDTGVLIELVRENPPTVTFARADQVETVEVADGAAYAEGQAFGSTWAITTEGGLHLELRHDPTPPLTAEQARERAVRELDSNLGCEGDTQTVDAPVGTVRLVRVDDEGAIVCSAVIGLFTAQVLPL